MYIVHTSTKSDDEARREHESPIGHVVAGQSTGKAIHHVTDEINDERDDNGREAGALLIRPPAEERGGNKLTNGVSSHYIAKKGCRHAVINLHP